MAARSSTSESSSRKTKKPSDKSDNKREDKREDKSKDRSEDKSKDRSEDKSKDKRADSMSDDYYEILEIPKNASEEEIKSAYRRLAQLYHPDKNPGREDEFKEKFQKISAAYEVLKDKNKRRIYDQFGLDGLSHFADGNNGSHDVINRPADMMYNLHLSLVEFYNGTEKIITLPLSVICTKCDGGGLEPEGKDKDKEEDKEYKSRLPKLPSCSKCFGNGKIKQTVMHMGMVLQQIVNCKTCKGKGVIISEHDNLCSNCNGKRIEEKKVEIKVTITKGMLPKQRIICSGKGNQSPNSEPGNVIIILFDKSNDANNNDNNNDGEGDDNDDENDTKDKDGKDTKDVNKDGKDIKDKKDANKITKVEDEFANFSRNDEFACDLDYEKTISLIDALLGFEFTFKHLNGKYILFKSPPGAVISHRETFILENQGMPVSGTSVCGDLHVCFNIKMPTNEAMSDDLGRKLLAGAFDTFIQAALPSELKTTELKTTELTTSCIASSFTTSTTFSSSSATPTPTLSATLSAIPTRTPSSSEEKPQRDKILKELGLFRTGSDCKIDKDNIIIPNILSLTEEESLRHRKKKLRRIKLEREGNNGENNEESSDSENENEQQQHQHQFHQSPIGCRQM